ncbi:MAG: acylphosphatase [Deltaproteobacteria bacterium]|nr:acylphosphatase [Deltaproteobacteria bacterium]
MSDVAAHLYISGRVQGVWYRGSTQSRAAALGLDGWVRNLPDGRVEAHVQGPQGKVNELIAWCRQGPPAAIVDDVEVRWVDVGKFSGFEVR